MNNKVMDLSVLILSVIVSFSIAVLALSAAYVLLTRGTLEACK